MSTLIKNDLNFENQKLEKSDFISKPLVITGLVIAIVMAFSSTSQKLRTYFSNQQDVRKIIAKNIYVLKENRFIILKVKTHDGINLEIYLQDNADFNYKLHQSFVFDGDQEAYISVQSQPLNLGLIDINHDFQDEIISPTVDKNGNSRLNVIEYNYELNQFILSNES